VNEVLAVRLLKQLAALGCWYLDKKAKHAVMPDLERTQFGLVNQTGLQSRNYGAGLATQGPLLVQLRVIPLAHKAAISTHQRQVLV
jgi:hypothetical protein